MMVQKLEDEDPHIFEDPDKTFIDLFMKSGLYITELVKRLFNNPVMKEKIPDNDERLKHIWICSDLKGPQYNRESVFCAMAK
jgi:type II restriction enzyme